MKSFNLDSLNSSWGRSPTKSIKLRRRMMKDSHVDAEASKRSPTRVMDFRMDDVFGLEGATIKIISLNDSRASIVEELSIDSFDISEPHDIITPISHSVRRRQRKAKTMPTLAEGDKFNAFTESDDCILSAGSVVIKRKKKSHLPRPSRSEKLNELIEEAVEHAGIGDEEEAVKIYKRALRFADSSIVSIRDQIKKSVDKHPVALKSIQTRLQEDLLEIVLLIGKIKTQMATLYERQGDYSTAIMHCKEAKSLYKKQKKICPPAKVLTTAENVTLSPGNSTITSASSLSPGRSPGSLSTISGSSRGSAEIDVAGVWYVPCPQIDKLVRDSSLLLDRLRRAQSTFEDRRKMVEEILLLRQEIAATFDADYRKRLYAKAESLTKHALAVERMALGRCHPQIADTLQLLSTMALEQQDQKPGSRDTAIQYLLQGLEINQKSLGKKHPRTGQDLLQMARLYQQPAVPGMSPDDVRRRQDEDRAIQYFGQAADIFRNVKGAHPVVGSILNDLAVIHVARRDFRKALELLRESLKSYEADAEEGISNDIFSEDGAGLSIDAVQVWRNTGECYVNLREFERAIEAFVCALNLQRDARRKYDAVSDNDLESVGEEKSFLVHLMPMISDESIGDTVRRLGKAFTAAGKLKEAMIVLREAMQIHRSAVVESQVLSQKGVDPELPARQDQLANTLYCIAEVYVAANDCNGAIRLFNESMQLRTTADGHRSEEKRCNMIHCAMCLVGIANVNLRKNEYVKAHTLYNNALFFCEAQGIPFDHPIVTMIESKRKEAEKLISQDPNRLFELDRLQQTAESCRTRGELDEAISNLSEALTLSQSAIVKSKAAGLEASKEIAGTIKLLHTMGQVFAEKGDREEAERAHNNAVRLYRKYVGKRAPCYP